MNSWLKYNHNQAACSHTTPLSLVIPKVKQLVFSTYHVSHKDNICQSNHDYVHSVLVI